MRQLKRNPEYDRIFNKVKEHMGWDKAKVLMWFETPNPMLGGVAPLYMVNIGRAWKLERWVDVQIDEGKQ